MRSFENLFWRLTEIMNNSRRSRFFRFILDTLQIDCAAVREWMVTIE